MLSSYSQVLMDVETCRTIPTCLLLSRDLSNGITWNGQSRTEGHFLSQNPFRRIAQVIFGASVFFVYLLSCYEDTDFGFAYEKKKCSVSIDILQVKRGLVVYFQLGVWRYLKTDKLSSSHAFFIL